MKILVVGGAGYIGGYLSDLLLRSGHDITVYDNLMFETRYLKDINFIYGDIREKEKLLTIIILLALCLKNTPLLRKINIHHYLINI